MTHDTDPSPQREAIEVLPVGRALIAVADKAGIVGFAQRLVAADVRIVSTGNTAKALADAGVPVTPVSDVTGFPEMLGGRVKTLHPHIHGGILADKRNPSHVDQLAEHGIEPFDLVVVNLYPFREAVASGAPDADVVEQIDIGGPAMVRAAAKNFESVAVVVSPHDYPTVAEQLERTGGVDRELRLELAREAFAHTASYDAAIADWIASAGPPTEGLPTRVRRIYASRGALRYGENPRQRGGLYAVDGSAGPLGGGEVLQGKEMSFNNWLDAEAARALVSLFDPDRAADGPAVVIIKHNNPCGVACADTLGEAYGRAYACDTVSAFGGIVAFNGEVDEAAALATKGVFTEVVIAPSYSAGALAAFAQRENLRVVRAPLAHQGGLDVRQIDGGALIQDADTVTEVRADMRVATTRAPTEGEWRDLLFAWRVAAKVKSNAIVLARDLATVGIGAGQMNRVISVDIASRQAGERAQDAAMASDAFFPFRDSLDRAAEAGVTAVIHPGGSMRDDQVLAAAEEHGMAMVLTGRRHFRH
jgi:phosphoribosylaminoimidazolecarboxamide formyltransferase/IMP cyclohydrolase